LALNSISSGFRDIDFKRIGVVVATWPFKVTRRHRSRDHSIPYGPFPIVVLWNGVSISNGFRDIQWRMWRNGSCDFKRPL